MSIQDCSATVTVTPRQREALAAVLMTLDPAPSHLEAAIADLGDLYSAVVRSLDLGRCSDLGPTALLQRAAMARRSSPAVSAGAF